MKNNMPMPYIFEIDDNDKALTEFERKYKNRPGKVQDIILRYPTVYLHSWEQGCLYDVYIGESNNIIQRTRQHYAQMDIATGWQRQIKNRNAKLYIVGHEHFNKSMTLDIENRLMLYMMCVQGIREIHNRRGNPQNKYYPYQELDNIFSRMWRQLHKLNPDLFPIESKIKHSAVFKASPLHNLTQEQEDVKGLIIEQTLQILAGKTRGNLIFIEGEAGTGKTVLNSSTFYELYNRAEELGNIKGYLLVNHDEQITVYEQIAKKLGITEKYGNVVCKPTTFINHHDREDPVDIVFVDEAHLLLTQGKQSYQGKNQLQDIIDRARVVVVMFDENQILTTEQVWERDLLNQYRGLAQKSGTYIKLKKQLRISAGRETVEWIDAFTKGHEVRKIPKDEKNYEIRVFEKPEELERAIKEKASKPEYALSRLVATYDWEYSSKARAEVKDRTLKYWEVLIGQWHKPWNRELERELDQEKKRQIRSLAWAEQPQTINEVGSTFTIQGFDLSYVGVILGPSVKYRDGKIVFDPNVSFNHKAVRNRTMSDGSRQKFGEQLIQNEVRVLMTRGVNGLYIYAYDEQLRNALLNAIKQI